MSSVCESWGCVPVPEFVCEIVCASACAKNEVLC